MMMIDADVSDQVQQMGRLTRQEAQEKANQTSVSAEEELSIVKLQLVEAGKEKIRAEYERRGMLLKFHEKLQYSIQLNASHTKLRQAQDDVVNNLKEATRNELLKVSDDKGTYKALLKGLIIQSLLQLKEQSVLLRCREMDLGLVNSVLEEAKYEYAKKAGVRPPSIIVDRVYLPPPPNGDGQSFGNFCSGGVVLASQDGKIVYENTLDARLDLVFQQKLPGISKHLYRQANM